MSLSKYQQPFTKFIGDTFTFGAAIEVEGVNDFSAWEVTAAAQLPSGYVVSLAVTWVDHVAGTYEFSADTSTWAPGWINFNMCYRTDSAEFFSTKLSQVLMVQRLAPRPGVA